MLQLKNITSFDFLTLKYYDFILEMLWLIFSQNVTASLLKYYNLDLKMQSRTFQSPTITSVCFLRNTAAFSKPYELNLKILHFIILAVALKHVGVVV